ncbi:MFS transporter [Tessaracoccus sp. HDW20]|uniref:hypothetical protein n=1 Tax=Tessaracoccus coleopterorum TaxID=2714950 RepID=UPI0018D3B19A|nr:hypothetical protein [Tessaracoccus coleopterorum]NHB84879.1 MFS transporter [Tessaracoccus coleopterorum]
MPWLRAGRPRPGRLRGALRHGGGARAVAAGLADAGRHLRTRPTALIALALMAVTRLLFGLLSVAVILAARHLWHPVSDPDAALADLSVWGVATGAGFILAAPFVPVLARQFGLGRTAVGLLAGGAAASLVSALTTAKPVLFAISFLVGLSVQSFKICVDTIVQAHVDDRYKGRVFTFYDMAFNGAFVLAGVVAAFVLPPSGLSTAAFLGSPSRTRPAPSRCRRPAGAWGGNLRRGHPESHGRPLTAGPTAWRVALCFRSGDVPLRVPMERDAS